MDDVEFQNTDTWKGGDKFGLTFKQIILMHINRCVLKGTTEWHGGYWNEKQKSNWVEKYYVPDSREVYNNSIRMLRCILLGYFDDIIESKDKELQEELVKAYEEYEKSNKDKSAKVEYYEAKVDIYIRMFEELIMLSKRLNFFQEEDTKENQE